MLTKTSEKIKVDLGDGMKEHIVYEKNVLTKIRVNKPILLKRKKEIEAELMQINLDLSQIEDDEKNSV